MPRLGVGQRVEAAQVVVLLEHDGERARRVARARELHVGAAATRRCAGAGCAAALAATAGARPPLARRQAAAAASSRRARRPGRPPRGGARLRAVRRSRPSTAICLDRQRAEPKEEIALQRGQYRRSRPSSPSPCPALPPARARSWQSSLRSCCKVLCEVLNRGFHAAAGAHAETSSMLPTRRAPAGSKMVWRRTASGASLSRLSFSWSHSAPLYQVVHAHRRSATSSPTSSMAVAAGRRWRRRRRRRAARRWRRRLASMQARSRRCS